MELIMMVMKRTGLAVVIGALCVGTLGLSACSHREPTDAQLVALLRVENARPQDLNAQLDAPAIQCLRAWSGETDLLAGLSPDFSADAGKKACRTRLDGWLADKARNADQLGFDDVSAPKAVRRAIALSAMRQTLPNANDRPPAAITQSQPATLPAAPPPAKNVDLGEAGIKLKEAEDLCAQAQKLAAGQADDSRVKRFAGYCVGKLPQLRGSMEQLATSGRDPAQMERLAGTATNLADVARKAIASTTKQ
jgi:hypothetical protein